VRPAGAPRLLGAPNPPWPAGRPRLPATPPTPDCLGIMAGLGRGIPGTPPGRGARKSVGSPGRSLRLAGARGGSSPGAGRRSRCIPCVEEKGLLPGRGPVGRGARGTAGGDVGSCARAAGATGAVGAGGADGVDGACSGARTAGAAGLVSVGLVATGESMLVSAEAAEPFDVAAALPLDPEAGAALAAFLASLASAAVFQASPRSAVSRRTTGASTVEDADLTNSPMSVRAASTSLLGTPNSLASSWTRTFATVLLRGGPSPGGLADR
jgi:hypothetical protein